MSFGVVLFGDDAAVFASRFEEIGVQTATTRDRLDAERVFALGAGGGGREALMQREVAGAIAIDTELPLADARGGAIAVPVLAVVAEEDEGTAYSFAKALREAGVPNETVVYDGVERGFVGTHAQATDDAWKLVRRFTGVPSEA